MEALKSADGLSAELENDEAMKTLETISDVLVEKPEPVWHVTEKTVWGEKGVWLIPDLSDATPSKIDETEEQKTAREAFQKAGEEALALDKEKVDAWWEICLELDEDGKYKFKAEHVAGACNFSSLLTMPMFGRKGKKMTAMEVVKLRTRYGRPAAACHSKGKKYVLGQGRKRQGYVVGTDGAWRKVVNA
jgi:hypothetical protein